MTSNLITATFLAYRDMLELLDGLPQHEADGLTAAEIASRTGRVASNLRRDVSKFIGEGYLAEGGDASRFVIGETGKAALAAWRKIDGVTGGGGIPRWPLHRIAFNPLNPRKHINDETIAGLAESIVAGEDVLEPIILYPEDENGMRTLHAGERRVRACQLLAQDGRLPAVLTEGVMFVERAGTPEEALFVALVENAQREDVTPWEDAKGLKAFKDRTGLSARQIAFKLGRASPGSEEGVRDVQEKIRTVEKSTPDDIARVDAGQESFDWLKRRIRKPAVEVVEQLRPVDLLLFGELLHKGKTKPKNRWYGDDTECSYLAEKDPILKGLVAQGLATFTLENRDDYKSYVATGRAAYELSNSAEFVRIMERDEKGGDAQLYALRVAAVGEARADELKKSGRYHTEWLNGPFKLSEKAQAKADAAKAKKKTETAETRERNAKAKAVREAHAAQIVELNADLRTTTWLGSPTSEAARNVHRLTAKMRELKMRPPFRVTDYGVVDDDGESVIEPAYRFYDDKPLVREILTLALNLAFAFPASKPVFLQAIADQLSARGVDPAIAKVRAARALARYLDDHDCEFGDHVPLTSMSWQAEDAAAIADDWFQDYGDGLPESGYLAWIRLFLESWGWSGAKSAEAAEKALAWDLKQHGVAFGDPNYGWGRIEAEALVRDYYASLNDWQKPKLPQDQTPVVILLDTGSFSVPPDHWADPDAWVARHVRAGELIDPSEVEAIARLALQEPSDAAA